MESAIDSGSVRVRLPLKNFRPRIIPLFLSPPPEVYDQRRRAIYLDGLRGLAALCVVIFHARCFLQEGYHTGFVHHPQAYSLLEKGMLYFFGLFRYGDSAVMFFFVLSGFVIHLRYARRLRVSQGSIRFGWTDFVQHRVLRLIPALLLALILTAVLDHIGMSHHFSIYTGHTRYSWMDDDDIIPHYGLATLLGNLAFVMRAYVPNWGTDGALWSLKYEWWFYMVYPLFWPLLRRSIKPALAAVLVMWAISFAPWPPALILVKQVFHMMPIWWLGVVLAETYAGRLRISFLWFVPLAFLFPIGLVFQLNLVVGLGFTGLLAVIFECERRGCSMAALEFFKPLGDISYSLYLCHLPVLILVGGWLISRSSSGALPVSFAWMFGTIGVALLIAWGSYLVAERPFQRPDDTMRPSHRASGSPNERQVFLAVS